MKTNELEKLLKHAEYYYAKAILAEGSSPLYPAAFVPNIFFVQFIGSLGYFDRFKTFLNGRLDIYKNFLLLCPRKF